MQASGSARIYSILVVDLCCFAYKPNCVEINAEQGRAARASMFPLPRRRSVTGFDIITEFSITLVKLDWSSLLHVSPDLRQGVTFLDVMAGQAPASALFN